MPMSLKRKKPRPDTHITEEVCEIEASNGSIESNTKADELCTDIISLATALGAVGG